jgi:hypothetical protein
MTAEEKLEKIGGLMKLLATNSDIDDEIDWLKAQQKILTQKTVDHVGGEPMMKRLLKSAKALAKAQSKGRGLDGDGAVELPHRPPSDSP